MSAKLRPPAAPATLVSMILVFAVAGLVALSGAEAAAVQQVNCGDTITTDTTLHKDLVDCPNNGIVIGANGITLNLNGHTIDGDGTEFAACHPRREFCDFGVLNDGHDRVTVRHGSVREFEAGAFANEARHNRLLGISSSTNRFAGLAFADSARSLVRNSSGSDSTARQDGAGMALFFSQHLRILDNSFRHNPRGIRVLGSTNNLIKGNLSSRNEIGIELEGDNHNRVRRNRSIRDGLIGIYVAPGSGNVIARNRVSHTRGAQGGEGVAIEVDGGDHNVIARNAVHDIRANAISVGFDVAVGNVVRRITYAGPARTGCTSTTKPSTPCLSATTPSARKMTALTSITRRRS